MNERTLVFSEHNAFERARFVQIEDADRHALIAAQRKRGRVKNLQFLLNRFIKRNGLIELSVRIFFRIRRINSVNLCGLQHHIGADFSAAKRCGGIRCKERIAGTGGKDHNTALL